MQATSPALEIENEISPPNKSMIITRSEDKMKTLLRFSFVMLCVVSLVSTGWAQTTYYSQGSVDPTVKANWNTNPVGGGASPGSFNLGDVFIIQNAHNMTTTASWSVIGTVEISNGGTLTASNSVTADSIIIDGGGILTMNADVTANRTLDLGSDIITTGGNTLTVGDFGTPAGIARRSTGYVIGNLRYGPYGYNNTCTFTFDVGTANGYSPIKVVIPNVSGPDYLTATVVQAQEPNVAQTDSVLNRYWILTAGPTLSFTGTVTIDLTYLHADFPLTTMPEGSTVYGSVPIEDTLIVGAFRSTNPDAGWNFPTTYLRTPGGTNDGGTVQISNVNSPYLTANLTIGFPTSSLPVEMVSFAATANRLTAELKWSTATEVNNFGFDIERRLINQSQVTNWTKVGFVPGAGTSSSLHNYSYVDNDVQAGLYEYRLKQIDRDGSFKYSKSMQVEVGMAPRVLSLGSNYPNPFNPSTTIEFSVPSDGRATLKVYNVLGQEVATLFDGVAVAGNLNKATFDASRLSSGVYFSRLESGGHALVKRMLLMK
jgi:hypothetical protein